MVKKMTGLVLAFLLMANICFAANFTKKETKFIRTVAAETKIYDRNTNRHDLLVYAKSSYRVARMFPEYPENSLQDTVARFMAWGGIESVWTPNYVNINVPGAKYASGRVKFFSVDYGWTGLNSENVKWTYEVASLLQQKRELPKSLHPELLGLLRTVKIPKKLKLKRIDTNLVNIAREKWKTLVRGKVDPNKMSSKIVVPYEELTEDDVDSLLIYRALVEMDRHVRGWRGGAYSKGLYDNLKSLELWP